MRPITTVLPLVLAIFVGIANARGDLFDRKIKKLPDEIVEIGTMDVPKFYLDKEKKDNAVENTVWVAFTFEQRRVQVEKNGDKDNSIEIDQVVIWRRVGSEMLVEVQGKHQLFFYEGLVKMPMTQKKPDDVTLVESMSVEYADCAWLQQLALEARAFANGQDYFHVEITEKDSTDKDRTDKYYLYAGMMIILGCLLVLSIQYARRAPPRNTALSR